MHRTVYVKTTESCNLNCKHCFTGGNTPDRKFLHLNKTKDWIKRFGQHVPDDDVHFELHGGEPFLAPVHMLKSLVTTIMLWGPKKRTIGATTNLTYKLTDELLEFIANDLDSIATSWDKGIRFANPKQEALWRENLDRVAEVKSVSLNVSVSRSVIEMDTDELLYFLGSLPVERVSFERITMDGNATQHLDLFPSNVEINDWYLRLYESTMKLKARSWFFNSTLEDVFAKFEKTNSSCGTFCRDCEEKLFTINADGSIAGCPNSAPDMVYSHIDASMEALFSSPKRIEIMTEERMRNPACFTCPVFQQCGSDCHQLKWEGDVCPAPKQLMMKLAGLDYSAQSAKPKRIIPIMAV